jgi:hypothetical protein
MSGESLGRGQGTSISCNGADCTEKSITGQIRRKDHRAYLKTIGWGRGSDRGLAYRPAEPEREEKRSMTRGGGDRLVHRQAQGHAGARSKAGHRG